MGGMWLFATMIPHGGMEHEVGVWVSIPPGGT